MAAETGISAQAVSLVMNEKSKGQLSDATREQVLRAAAKLGYCRNASAGILRGADTKAAAILTSQRLATGRSPVCSVDGSTSSMKEHPLAGKSGDWKDYLYAPTNWENE